MSNVLVKFDAEDKIRFRCMDPFLDRFFLRHMIEGGIVFNRFKSLGIEFQIFVAFEFLRIKRSNPIAVIPTGCSDMIVAFILFRDN